MTTFLEAHRIVERFAGGPALPMLLGMSGTAEPLLLYIRAAAALRGRDARLHTLPFNTLSQHLFSEPDAEREVLLLLPWDLVPESDWRGGLLPEAPDEAALRSRARAVIDRIAGRGAALVYLNAPTPPLTRDQRGDRALCTWLEHSMRDLGALVLDEEHFSLAGYLQSGCPVAGQQLGAVAGAIIEAGLGAPPAAAKVLVTDLDNTLWAGVIGDDGLEGIHHGPEGRGYVHFLLQGLLRRLRREGILLAAVTRNDRAVATGPFEEGAMLLREDDFVAFLASWNAKSAQIRELASRLNLGLDAFVFIDDNPLELAEVSLELPEVRCLAVPAAAAGFPAFLQELRGCFPVRELTAEDRERTALYRRRLEGMVPEEADGADLSDFLRDLRMTLRLHDRSKGDRTRAVQLINKTNQFNLNGVRVTEHDVDALLNAGGRLYTATLDDRTGTHGEILACLVDANGRIENFVMSCRVFQRRVEYAFLCWLLGRQPAASTLRFAATPRNGPLQAFLGALLGAAPADGNVRLDADAITHRLRADLSLFTVEEHGFG